MPDIDIPAEALDDAPNYAETPIEPNAGKPRRRQLMRRRRDPKCRHSLRVGRVSWPTVLVAGEAHASTYVCDRQDCMDDAAEWVESITGHRGVFVPFDQPVATQPIQGALDV